MSRSKRLPSMHIQTQSNILEHCTHNSFSSLQEMETAVRLKLNLTVLVLNDNAYGMIKWKQNSAGFKK